MKKQILLFFSVAVAVCFTSCLLSEDDRQEPNPVDGSGQTVNDKLHLRLTVSGVKASGSTRALTEPLGTNVIKNTVHNGYIFIIGSNGQTIIASALIDESKITGTGQNVNNIPETAAGVFIVANVPGYNPATAATDVGTFSTLAEVLNHVSSIPNSAADDYTKTTLSNENGALVSWPTPVIHSDPTKPVDVSLTVSLQPTLARLELAELWGQGTDLKSFEVTGVFLDNYYTDYTWGGGFDPAGYQFVWNPTDSATWNVGDDGTTWASDVNKKAKPPGTDVWAYNVAAGTVPTLVIRVEKVQYDDGAPPHPITGHFSTYSGPFYLRIRGYKYTAADFAFQRGSVYSLGSLQFTIDNLGLMGNSVAVVAPIHARAWTETEIGAENELETMYVAQVAAAAAGTGTVAITANMDTDTSDNSVTVPEGRTVNLSATPTAPSTSVRWTVVDDSGTDCSEDLLLNIHTLGHLNISFRMPAYNITITPTFN